jgi:hypothetical protein
MASRACTVEKNKKKCNCTYEPCSRKGVCCECIQYHWFSSREMPACFFPDDEERTYDRSLENFLKIWNRKLGR